MSGRQMAVGALLSSIIAACSAGAQPAPSMLVRADPSHSSSPLARVSPIPTTVVLTPVPSATTTPSPAPSLTSRPAPPTPTGVRHDMDGLEFCDTGGEGVCETSGMKHTVRWKAPRTTGIEIRVYAVTECLSDDSSGAVIDGWCLRESTANEISGAVDPSISVPFDHSAPPSSMLVLLAKAPASNGKVTWESPWDLLGYDEGDASYPGPEVYSIVVAAFDKAGRFSGLAIADSTHLCDLIDDMECPDDWTWPPGDGE